MITIQLQVQYSTRAGTLSTVHLRPLAVCDGGDGGGGHGGSGNGGEGGGGDDSGTGGGGEGGVGGIGGGGGGCAGEGGSSGEVQPEPTRVDRWLDGRPPEG